jgi:hypothetical protein
LLRGAPVADDQVMRVDRGRELEFQTLGSSEMLTVAMHAPLLLHELALATLAPAFFDGKPGDRLALRGPQLRPGLNRLLLDLLDRGFAQSEGLWDHEYGRAWEHEVLDNMLFVVSGGRPGS